jgi:ABC-2 type transport system permease protein
VLLVSFVVVSSVQGIGTETGHDTVAQVAGLFSPYTLVNEVQVFLFDSPAGTQAPPTGNGIGLLHVLAVLVVLLGSVGAMLWRYRKVAA